jgi:RHS repeat-associated protein
VLAYSKTGNIERLQRTAVVSGVTQTIDDLVYTYSGNQSTRIDDQSTSDAKQQAFNDAASEAGEIGFNSDGQMNLDKNKGITAITYDAIGTISKVSFDNSNTRYIQYEYDRGGNKLKKTYVNGSAVTITEYIDGMQYETQPGGTRQLAFIQTEEGRARPGTGNFVYEYDLKDHLGNNRVTIKPQTSNPSLADIVQEKSYYAFGMEMDLGLAKQDYHKYTYSGKELQEELGQLDFGARFYDPQTGRWTSVDPSAENDESYSPYNYVFNNPVLLTDPDGRWPGLPSLHTALDVAGLVPGLGEIADGVNAVIYLAEGNKVDAALSVAAMIPLAGTAATAVKFARTADKAITAAKAADKVSDGSKMSKAVTKLENAAKGTKGNNSNATDFVVNSKGEAVAIPKGAKGPSSPQKGSGMSYQGGSGGKGMNKKTTGVRIMDANSNQGRRVNYMNKSGQTVDPKSGQTIPNKDSRGHLPYGF